MGPRSDNRGYGSAPAERTAAGIALQWVHGLITGVMRAGEHAARGRRQASMGPRSDNRGYGSPQAARQIDPHASMGPRSDNRGYVLPAPPAPQPGRALQWVHGLITVVMPRQPKGEKRRILGVAKREVP